MNISPEIKGRDSKVGPTSREGIDYWGQTSGRPTGEETLDVDARKERGAGLGRAFLYSFCRVNS